MPEWGIKKLLEHGYAGRLATVGTDGWPYVCPLLMYTWTVRFAHNTRARASSHQRRAWRVCFEIDEAAVFSWAA
jgi:nitroimidazol reductase NimA-like FMN-containing flavoprotein (pyridoxamine 5'-phosphate oxidase superfamily)